MGEDRQVLLVRHAESVANRERLLTGRIDVELTPGGRRQCRAASRYIRRRFRVDLAFSSPMRRSMETAGLLTRGSPASVQPNELLLETDFGDWEGLDRAQLAAKPQWEQYVTDPFHFTFPGGESPQQVRERVERFRGELLARDDWKTALVVSHYTPLVFYVLMVMGVADRGRAAFKIRNAAVSVIGAGEYGEYVEMLNYRP